MTNEGNPKLILLKNVSIFDAGSGTFRKNADILIEDGIVREIGEVKDVDEESLRRVDCSHKYALPGLFESHAHLTVLTNQPEKDKKDILMECAVEEGSLSEELDKQVLEQFVKKGITQIRDCGGPVKTLKAMKNKISSGEYVGPDLFYAGPMIEKSPLRGAENNKRWPGFTVAVDSKGDAENIIEQISGQGARLVKTFSKFDEEVLKYLLKKAKEHNLPVTHDPGPTFFHAVPVDRAIDLGIRCVEHGKSPWYVVLKDDLKAKHDSLKEADPKAKESFIDDMFSMGIDSISMMKLERLRDKMVDKDVYFCPTLHVFKHYAEHPEQFNEKEPKKFKNRFGVLYEISRFITKELKKGGMKVLVGHDGWNPIFTLNEMQELKDIGLSEGEIIKGATKYPASCLGIAHQLGSISPGKRANILILEKNPLENIENVRTMHAVLKGGKIVFHG